MLFVPLPFVVALLLAILFAALLRLGEGTRVNGPFLVLIAFCAVQSVLIGLRWGYGIAGLRFALPVLAAFLPPLAYAGFRRLIHDARPKGLADRLAFVVPALIVVVLVFTLPVLIDLFLIVLFVGYALALLSLTRSGPDALDEARFDGVASTYQALYLAAASLCVSALFDLAVLFDFEQIGGANAAAIIGNANFLGLLMIGLTASIAGRSQPADEEKPATGEADGPPTGQDQDVLDRIDTLMRDQKLYRDENLNLSRLARRAGMPARQISGAINRLTGGNVSQYVNGWRIDEARRLLRETNASVASVMLDAGFQTKSNFNREFRRVTGASPAAWRAANRSPAGSRS